MSNSVKSTVINDPGRGKITFQFEFDIMDLMPLDLSESEMVAIKDAGESNDPLRMIRVLASIVEKLERKTIGDLNGKN